MLLITASLALPLIKIIRNFIFSLCDNITRVSHQLTINNIYVRLLLKIKETMKAFTNKIY